jgi:opacity protein-like surface antigen
MKLSNYVCTVGIALTATVSAQEESPYSLFIGGSAGYVLGDYDLGPVGDALGLDDWDEPMYAVQLGIAPNENTTYYLELGLTENNSGFRGSALGSDIEPVLGSLVGDGPELLSDLFPSYNDTNTITATLNVDMEIVPVTLNYRQEYRMDDRINAYVGAGVGIALVDTRISLGLSNDNGDPAQSESASFDDTVFYAHIFAGYSYSINDSVELFGGVRYIFMGDIEYELAGLSATIDSPLDGAFQIELGARYNF